MNLHSCLCDDNRSVILDKLLNNTQWLPCWAVKNSSYWKTELATNKWVELFFLTQINPISNTFRYVIQFWMFFFNHTFWNVGGFSATCRISWHFDVAYWDRQQIQDLPGVAKVLATPAGVGFPVVSCRSEKIMPRHWSQCLYV